MTKEELRVRRLVAQIRYRAARSERARLRRLVKAAMMRHCSDPTCEPCGACGATWRGIAPIFDS